jgi:hypothetical protein
MSRGFNVRAAVNMVGGTALVGAVVYIVMVYATAETRVRGLCSKITVGMTISDLNTYARRVGLGPPAYSDGTSFVVEHKTFGRYGCRIEATGGSVRSVTYNYAD